LTSLWRWRRKPLTTPSRIVHRWRNHHHSSQNQNLQENPEPDRRWLETPMRNRSAPLWRWRRKPLTKSSRIAHRWRNHHRRRPPQPKPEPARKPTTSRGKMVWRRRETRPPRWSWCSPETLANHHWKPSSASRAPRHQEPWMREQSYPALVCVGSDFGEGVFIYLT